MQPLPQLQSSCPSDILTAAPAGKVRKLQLEEMKDCVHEVALGSGVLEQTTSYIILPVGSTVICPSQNLSPKR